MSSFVTELNKDFYPDPKNSVFSSIFNEYERVIVESLITSFGLDFLVQDNHGGDVDTINNVRKIGKDQEMTYKNSRNQSAYDNRGEYNTYEYHQDQRYIEQNRKVSETKKRGDLTDSYTGKKVAKNAHIDLDHVISAKEIHEDRGRILADLKGTDLANCKDNLKPTDRSINRSMQDKDIEKYLQKLESERPQRQARINELKSKNSLSDKERKELAKMEKLEEINPDKVSAVNRKSRASYEAKVAKTYYTSQRFIKDTASAAGIRGVEMGLRQLVGFVFFEIWISAKNEIQSLPTGKDFKDILEAVGRAVKTGLQNAKAKYKEVFERFREGFIAGALASLTTTICNIFFTTAKNIVRCIRQIYSFVVEAGEIILFNPDKLRFGDRLKNAAIVLATGASVIVGTAVGELINKSPLATIPGLGSFVIAFCSSLVSGLMSCSLLIFLDRSKFMNKIVRRLNRLPSMANNYKETAEAFERLSAELAQINISKFRAEDEKFKNIALKICSATSEQEINTLLLSTYSALDIKIPWKGDFDSFMNDKKNVLVFE